MSVEFGGQTKHACTRLVKILAGSTLRCPRASYCLEPCPLRATDGPAQRDPEDGVLVRIPLAQRTEMTSPEPCSFAIFLLHNHGVPSTKYRCFDSMCNCSSVGATKRAVCQIERVPPDSPEWLTTDQPSPGRDFRGTTHHARNSTVSTD